jgi:hypothetical protein
MGVYLKLRNYAWDSTVMPFTCFTICHIYPNLGEEKKQQKISQLADDTILL